MSEQLRLKTLCDRDGMEAARQWAEWAARLYRNSIESPAHFASQADWKPRFEYSIRNLSMFAEQGRIQPAEVIHQDQRRSPD